jgi:lipid II:glycine glycyltransferase (peptidoglycan interpeptide bridge formation enzyme)
MEAREITEKKQWEDFLLGCEEKTFLQSFNWGEFNGSLGSKIWRLGVFEGDDLVATAQFIKVSARRGRFLFLPHGPNVAENCPEQKKKEIFEKLLLEAQKIAIAEKCWFIRIAPIWKKNAFNEKIFNDSGFRDAPIHMHPEFTWELGLEGPQEEILARMRKTTRYLIKQAEKSEDIEIVQSKDIRDLKLFDPVFRETAKRQHFVPFSLSYLEKEFQSFANDGKISFFFGKYKGQVVSAAMIIFWSGIAFYHQSGSTHSKAPVSYLLQWEAIKEAKRRGCNAYNFWGIAPFRKIGENDGTKIEIKDKNHPWYGLSLFKMGFGGGTKEYVKTKDLPLSSLYWLTFIFENLRKKKRNL